MAKRAAQPKSSARLAEDRCDVAYKTVLVQVEPNDEACHRLRISVQLAQQFGAWLIGLFARNPDSWPDPTGMSQRVKQKWIAEDIHNAEACFLRETRPLGDKARWVSVARAAVDAVAGHSFAGDLVIPNSAPLLASDQLTAYAEESVVRIGCPVLWIPRRVENPQVRRVVIGWKNTKPACRAVWAAMPFLKHAEAVHVVGVARAQDNFSASAELRSLVERLRRHGVEAHGRIVRRTASIAEDMLDFAQSVSAELIVAGATSHSRLRQHVCGGVTEELFAVSTEMVLSSQ
jgi:nucleotide-binding universal stress UspA family protein